MKTVIQVVRDRRSQKTFTSQPVSEQDIRTMIDAAILAPNHKLTQPWIFAVLGRRARNAYAETRAQLKVGQDADPAAAEKRAKVIAEYSAIPAVIAVLQKLEGEPNRKREDYAAIFMAIENMLLVAVSLGLATKIHTGDILTAPAMRELVKAEENEQIVAIIHLGEPAEPMKPKPRIPAEEKTRWIP